MSMLSVFSNRRILVIDDNEAIHQDFRKILGADQREANALAASEAAPFGDVAPERQGFELDSAYQGEQALALAVRALENGKPSVSRVLVQPGHRAPPLPPR